MQKNNHLLAAGILLGMGVIFAGIAAFIFYQGYMLERDGIQAEGTVIGLAESRDEDGTSYAPVIRFQTQGGREFEFKSNYYSNPPQYKIGQKVTIIYPPDRPGEAQVKGAGNLLVLIFGLVGGFEILLGLFFAARAMLAFFRGE
jgi:hypothetical protein